MENNQCSLLREYISKSDNIVFFGGAGVSTESGIPDFRSKNGLYNQHNIQFNKYSPEYLLSRECLYNNPKLFYEFYRQKMDTRNIEPNITHKVLTKMEEQGRLKAIVTQNIDGLHQKAGSKNIFEIHGTTKRNYCSKCKKEYSSDFLFNTKEAIPKCKCRGLIRPDIVLYGEDLPNNVVNKAIKAIREADCLIIAGTSLTVYPADNYITFFKNKKLIVINKEKICLPINNNALIIKDSLGNVFAEIDTILNFLDSVEKELTTNIVDLSNFDVSKASQIAKDIIKIIDWNDSTLMHKGLLWITKNYLIKNGYILENKI